MNFYQSLLEATSEERQYLLSAPMIKRCFDGDFTLDHYVAFLLQAYHHVKHTVPLLMAVGAQLPEEKEWLREAVAEYIEEELGHQEWVLNDIAACGFDKQQARASTPAFATEMMVSYAYDAIRRTNPLAFFGMVLVLEGTSINLAEQAASHIAGKLGLPRKAFSYLNSHGALDQEHIKFYENLMNNITAQEDQAVIVHAAKRFYRLYGDVFRSLETPHGLNKQEQAA
ncbi:TenA family transcriptional regulator [Rheinheimera baltica]|uniref:TenA family transcriptional regulator n=1 Tax=Rheinheimera baltica TaxID=67576 RepID=UPI000403744A|nr:iron-containing redox enzyme family protein [Rheinheimera baltica]MDP5144490.1 iron-containing redox enzyme family protein [Rheinheimera baltica]MDP5190395.1 iron-containing redox enzyme family protein [Rheinheimera baltica]